MYSLFLRLLHVKMNIKMFDLCLKTIHELIKILLKKELLYRVKLSNVLLKYGRASHTVVVIFSLI